MICPAVAARNAVEHEVTFEDEMALLVVHGLLHLLGMDHEIDDEAERMEALEQQLLDRFYRVPPLLGRRRPRGDTAAAFTPEDVVLIVVIVVLLAASGLLALAETSLVRMSRIKAKSLVDERQARGQGRWPGSSRTRPGFPQPGPAAGPDLPAGLGHPGRHRGRAMVRGLGRAWSATVFEIVVIFVFVEAVPKNWAVHHPDRAALLSAPMVSRGGALPAGAVDLGRPHRAGQPDHRARRATRADPRHHRVRAHGHGRRGRSRET